MEEKKVVIFCSASYTIDPKYNKAAVELVNALCERGYTIVSGGCVKGTMGVIADAVVANGGRHIGVIPHFMEEFLHPGLTQTIWTDTMSHRKELMREGTVAAIALPGGIGTMDELIETHTLVKLHRYNGKVIAYNVDGFYNKFVELLDEFVDTEMLAVKDRELVRFPSTLEALLKELE